MDECEVCLRPTMFLIAVTFDDGETNHTVRYCNVCTAVVFSKMIERYNQAVDDNNAAVAEMLRRFGVE